MLSYALHRATHHLSSGKQKVWAVAIDKRGNLIAEAGNLYQKSHPAQAKYARMSGSPDKCFLHAEMLCMIRAAKTGKLVHTLYVARAGVGGKAMNAKPCVVCQKMLDTEFPEVYIEHT